MKAKTIVTLLGAVVLFGIVMGTRKQLEMAQVSRDQWRDLAREYKKTTLYAQAIARESQAMTKESLAVNGSARLDGWKDGWLDGAGDAFTMIRNCQAVGVSVGDCFKRRSDEVIAATNALPVLVRTMGN